MGRLEDVFCGCVASSSNPNGNSLSTVFEKAVTYFQGLLLCNEILCVDILV